jgi:hypothetical protein
MISFLCVLPLFDFQSGRLALDVGVGVDVGVNLIDWR